MISACSVRLTTLATAEFHLVAKLAPTAYSYVFKGYQHGKALSGVRSDLRHLTLPSLKHGFLADT
jgi:hypothetical protein